MMILKSSDNFFLCNKLYFKLLGSNVETLLGQQCTMTRPYYGKQA